MWLAPSHTGTVKEPKYGLFAGKAYKENQTLPNAELAIPLIDMIQDYNRDTTSHDAVIEFLESNLWTAEYVGSQWEGTLSAPVAIPGIGVLANYHTGISNVDFLQASVLLRDATTTTTTTTTTIGKTHLSRGAISPYHNVTLMATQPIPAGMELFANFGDEWDGNYTDDFYQDKIQRYDYDDADKIVRLLVDFYNDFQDLSLDFQEDVLDFFLDTVLGTAAGKHAKTIKTLIPENPRKLQKVLDVGGTFLYRYNDMIRSTEWLQTNGFCLNTLRIGTSTIPHAGRGAFATRSFSVGQTITITPMLHIADKRLLTMYPIRDFVNEKTGSVYKDYDRRSPPIGQQLLMNYCFGHAQSSLLLFPLGSMVTLINHSRKAPNAYVTWSKASDNNLSNQHQYHDYTIDQLANVDKVVLMMKVVALREIATDEEILLDYGPEWEEAWQRHRIQSEESSVQKGSYPLTAEDLRLSYKHKPFETRHTMDRNPYPVNTATACFLTTRGRPDGQPMFDALTSFAINEWVGPASFDAYKGARLFVVDVLDRKAAPDGGFFYNYTVNARVSATQFEQVVNVPHAACTFVDRPYTSKIHTKEAFRHPIGIMDTHFPQAWRDLR